jgi:hypothetical protein
VITSLPASGAEWFVAAGASGNGSSSSPFGSIQSALNVAGAGDRITVRPGTYVGRIATVRGGTASARIILRSEKGRGTVIVTAPGVVFSVSHAYVSVDGIVFDGQYAVGRPLDVNSGGDGFSLVNSEVRRSSRDCVALHGGLNDVLIDHSLIHHCLNAANGGTDAHGIVAGAVRNVTLRDTEIHTFSGDGFQADPGRSPAGWGGVTIENSKIWLAPLPQATNGFPAGAVTGENAVDTKVAASAPRARLVIRNSEFSGFRHGRITNQAALNLKENVDVTVNRVTVSDSEIAFRNRGPSSVTGGKGAWITVENAVVYNVTTAFRYENNIQILRVWNSTLGLNVTSSFHSAGSSMSGLDVRNLLNLGSTLPKEAAGRSSNKLATISTFVDAQSDNYQLNSGAPAVNGGETISSVTTDRIGVARPQGSRYDVGAFELPLSGGSDGAGGEPATADDIVLYAGVTGHTFGAWQRLALGSAAGGFRLSHQDAGAPASGVLAMPTNHFDVTFKAVANVPYRVWIRGFAGFNLVSNDSAWVQFSGAVDGTGHPLWRIGTSQAALYVLEACQGCGVSGWGWQDLGGTEGLGPTVRFATTGSQTIRVQTREDGLSIDQIFISPKTYLQEAPGLPRNDVTIVPQ